MSEKNDSGVKSVTGKKKKKKRNRWWLSMYIQDKNQEREEEKVRKLRIRDIRKE